MMTERTAGILLAVSSPIPRYLLPVAIFPLIAAAIMFAKWRRRIIVFATGLLIIMFAIFGLMNLPRAKPLTKILPRDSISCLVNFANQNPNLRIAGTYNDVRAMELYASSRVVTAQIHADRDRLTNVWQTFADRDLEKYHYLIVDTKFNPTMAIFWVTNDPSEIEYLPPDFATTQFGAPTKIIGCSEYNQIYFYATGSAGYEKLNQQINSFRGTKIQLKITK